jgi:predicted Zn-dependent protease
MKMSVLLLFVLLLFQVASAQQTYHDPVNQFSITVPSDWVEHQVKNTVFARRKDQKIMAVYASKNQSVETLAARLNETWRNLKMKKTFENNFPIHEVPSHLEVWEGSAGIVTYTVLISGDLSYVVLMEAPPSSSKSDGEELMQIIQSFRVVRTATEPPVDTPTAKEPKKTDDPEVDDF